MADWGTGIPEGFEEKVFEERFRAPAKGGKQVAGLGLGLAIARQLMREHGGDLTLVSRYKPTEFHIIIPRGSAHHEDSVDG